MLMFAKGWEGVRIKLHAWMCEREGDRDRDRDIILKVIELIPYGCSQPCYCEF